MDNDIGLCLSFRAVCFDFRSTSLNNRNLVSMSMPVNHLPYSKLQRVEELDLWLQKGFSPGVYFLSTNLVKRSSLQVNEIIIMLR